MTKNKILIISFYMVLILPLKNYAEYFTPSVWKSTKITFIDGRLEYKQIDVWIAPGSKPSYKFSKELIVGSYEDLRDTFTKSPDTFKEIYKTGIIQNYLDYTKMTSGNWKYSKLSLNDFNDAKQAYIKQGNWGILQTIYYSLKGTSRVLWALAILNSAEAVYSIGKACVQTVYYVLRYPVSGVVKGASSPIVLVGGSAWSTTASLVTTGWGVPFTLTIDSGILIKETIWGK